MKNENPFGHKVKLVCLESSLSWRPGMLGNCMTVWQCFEVFWGNQPPWIEGEDPGEAEAHGRGA